MTQKIILAIDGGGTKTEIILQTAQGETLFYDKRSGSNYRTMGTSSFKALFQSIVLTLQNRLDDPYIELAVLAFAGIDSPKDWEKAWRIVSEIFLTSELQVKEIILDNDVASVMRGVLIEEKGILLLSGTGSIAYGQDAEGRSQRVGGWGHVASDEGSGYWMGREIVRAIFQAEDGRGPQTLLRESALERMNLQSVHDLASLQSVHEIAGLASILEDGCENKDRVAVCIVERAARELALLVTTLARTLGFKSRDSFSVFISGGVLKHSAFIRNELKKQLLAQYPSCQFTVLAKAPIEYIAKRARRAIAE